MVQCPQQEQDPPEQLPQELDWPASEPSWLCEKHLESIRVVSWLLQFSQEIASSAALMGRMTSKTVPHCLQRYS